MGREEEAREYSRLGKGTEPKDDDKKE